jgi:hypothetical protein
MVAKRGIAVLAVLMLGATPAIAGPPFDTDDPEPTDLGHWEIYAFTAADHAGGVTTGATGLDLNFGAFKGVQLTATLPVDFVDDRGTHAGVGNVELGVKYRFIDRGSFSIAVFPRLIAPTASRRFGTGRAQMLLPVWAQKDMGAWSLFGGGGYTINPGAGNRNFWQGGVALTRQVTPKLSLGIEATAEGPSAAGERSKATLGIGGVYRLHGPFSLLFSAGPGFKRGSAAQLHGYAALAMNF